MKFPFLAPITRRSSNHNHGVRNREQQGAAPESRFALAYQRLAAEDEERSRWLEAHKNEGPEDSVDPREGY